MAASLLYRLGAEQGNPFAQKALGVLYNAGRGVEKDEAEAVRWFRAAAEQDFAEAKFNLGMSYARGEGVARNSSEAYFWMSLAAADGLETANRVLSAIRRSLDPEQISAIDDRVNAWLDPARLADVTGPDIEIADTLETLEQTIVIGCLVRDANKIGAFTIQDVDVAVAENGAFATTIFVPLDGVTVRIAAIDEFGNQNERAVRVTRVQDVAEAAFRFVALDPTARSSAPNANAVAIIIGVEGYQSLPAATYANRDAQMFFDFAQLALGIPVGNVRLLVDKEATDIEIFRAFQQWLPALVQPGETDVFVFFAGHGLAAADGSEMFLLPSNAAVDVLSRTALRRQEVFEWLQNSGARTVTVFLDTCFSGGTRGEETLVTDARGFGPSARDESVPESFTLISAATGAQTSTSLPEAQQGLFSYFLMKGMEGDADANGDNKITAGELHAFVAASVARQAPRLGTDQTPQIAGDPDRVLVGLVNHRALPRIDQLGTKAAVPD